MPKGLKGFQKGHKGYGGSEKTWFKKGMTPWSKGKKLVPDKIFICENCSKKFTTKSHSNIKHCSSFCNYNCKIKHRKSPSSKGEKNHNWKGEIACSNTKHWWIRKKYGNPICCEDCGLEGKKIGRRWNIDWSNIDHKYRRVREDYIGRCSSCHAKYDIKNNNKFKK